MVVHSVHIPVNHGTENIEIPIHDLPEDSSEIIQILKDEAVPLNVWLLCAIGYYNSERPAQYLEIAKKALEIDTRTSKKIDRIAILCSLAAYYVSLGSSCKDPKEKDNYFSEASKYYSKADNISSLEEPIWLGKGVLQLGKKDYERALQQFNTCLEKNSHNTPALIGKATALYHKKQYTEALDYFKQALESNPLYIYSRLGIAHCYVQLKRPRLARRWYERVLELDKNNADAYAGLAVIAFNGKQLGTRKEEGFKYVEKGYSIDPSHSRILNFLGSHFFYRKEYEKSIQFAKKSLEKTNENRIEAESLYILGRNLQSKLDFDGAYTSFYKSITLWPEYTLSQHGLTQMYIHRNEHDKAIKYADLIRKDYPNNIDALKYLATLNKRTKLDLSIEYLDLVTQQNPLEWESWLELGQLRESIKPAQALKSYESGADILIKNLRFEKECTKAEAEKFIPFELWNNLGALRYKLKLFDQSEIAYHNSLNSIEFQLASESNSSDPANPDSNLNGSDDHSDPSAKKEGGEEIKLDTITTLYNFARLYEDTNRTRESEILYAKILKNHPNYIECYLRLACIAYARKNMDAATKWIQCAFDIDLKNIDAWLLLGNFYLQEFDWQKAQEKFEHVINDISARDDYTKLSLGNIFYYASLDRTPPNHPNSHHRSNKNPGKKEKYLEKAQHYYLSVLNRHSSNLYATNGIGILLALKGYFNEAKNCFIQVRENTKHSKTPDVWINLANIYTEQKQYTNAIQTYIKCSELFYFHTNAFLFQNMANCYFLSEKYHEATKSLLTAIHLTPNDLTLWFNLAITQSTFVSLLLKKQSSNEAEIKQAKQSITQAKRIFGMLIEKAKQPISRLYSSTRCQSELGLCDALFKSLDRLLQQVEKQKILENEKIKIHQQLAEQAKLQKKKQEEDKHKKKKDVAERLEKEAEKIEKQRQELQQQWISDRKRTRSESGYDSDDDYLVANREESAEGQPPRKKSKSNKKAGGTAGRNKSRADGGEDGEEEDVDLDPRPKGPRSPDHASESWLEMRNRRGGRLNRLVEETHQEEEDRKRREIQKIKAGFQNEGDTTLPTSPTPTTKRLSKNRNKQTETDGNEDVDTDDNMDEGNADGNQESPKQLLQEKLTDIVSSLDYDQLKQYTLRSIFADLKKAGVSKKVLKDNKGWTKSSAIKLLAEYKTKFTSTNPEPAPPSSPVIHNDNENAADNENPADNENVADANILPVTDAPAE